MGGIKRFLCLLWRVLNAHVIIRGTIARFSHCFLCTHSSIAIVRKSSLAPSRALSALVRINTAVHSKPCIYNNMYFNGCLIWVLWNYNSPFNMPFNNICLHLKCEASMVMTSTHARVWSIKVGIIDFVVSFNGFTFDAILSIQLHDTTARHFGII